MIDMLPVEMIQRIATFLSPADLNSLAIVNTKLLGSILDKILMRQLCASQDFLQQCIIVAARKGNLVFVQLLLQQRLSEKNVQDLLSHALQTGQIRIVKYVATKKDINLVKFMDEYKQSALALACYSQNKSLINYLIYLGCDVNAQDDEGCTPLMIACQHSHIDIVEHLIKCGAKINEVTKDGVSCPLTLACTRYTEPNSLDRNDNFLLLRLLIQLGANMNIILSPWQPFIVYLSKIANASEVVAFFLDQGAELNEYHARMLLTNAVYSNRIDIVKAVIEKRPEMINISVGTTNLFSMLWYAMINDKTEIVTYLVEKGADVFQCSAFSTVTIDVYALEMGYKDIAHMLASYQLALIVDRLAAAPTVYQLPQTFFAAHTMQKVLLRQVPLSYLEQFEATIKSEPNLNSLYKQHIL